MEEISRSIQHVQITEIDTKNQIQQLQAQIRHKLSSAETVTKWLQSDAVTQEHLEKYCRAYEQETEELPDETELRFQVIESIARACLMAQVLLNKKSPDKFLVDVKKSIQIAREFIDLGETRAYFHQDYSDGFRYVVRCLEIDSLDLQNVGIEELNRMLKFIDQEFLNLSTKAYVGVLALKQYVIGNLCRASYDVLIEILTQMITKDPNNPEWHLCHYLVQRFQREFKGKYGKPLEGEIQAVLRAKNCPGGDENPMVLLACIEFLVNVVRWLWDYQSKHFSGYQFGDRFFSSWDEIVNYTKEQAQYIQLLNPTSVRCCVSLAKISSATLPHPFRDYIFAEKCLEKALCFHPHSGKVHHRMGLLQLYSQKDKAYTHLKEAYERDQRNFFALHDLLYILMADPDAKFDEITELFQSIDNSYWHRTEPHRYAILLFVHALFHLANGKKAEATEMLLEAFLVDENVTDLSSNKQDFFKRAGRFKWKGKVSPGIILGSISSALLEVVQNSTDEKKRNNALRMRNKFVDEFRSNENRQNEFRDYRSTSRSNPRGYQTHGGAANRRANPVGRFSGLDRPSGGNSQVNLPNSRHNSATASGCNKQLERSTSPKKTEKFVNRNYPEEMECCLVDFNSYTVLGVDTDATDF